MKACRVTANINKGRSRKAEHIAWGAPLDRKEDDDKRRSAEGEPFGSQQWDALSPSRLLAGLPSRASSVRIHSSIVSSMVLQPQLPQKAWCICMFTETGQTAKNLPGADKKRNSKTTSAQRHLKYPTAGRDHRVTSIRTGPRTNAALCEIHVQAL